MLPLYRFGRYLKIIGSPIVYIYQAVSYSYISILSCDRNEVTSRISLTHLGTFYYCYIRYISLNTLFSAILASYEVKRLEDVDNCHLTAQFVERNNKYYHFNIKFKWD